MTDENNKPQSRLLIVFDNIGSVNFSIQSEGISPLQLLLLSQYFELMAKNDILRQTEMIRQQEQANKAKIAVPQSGIIRA